MRLLQLHGNKLFFITALSVLLSACHIPPGRIAEEISAEILETKIWDDFMPGSKPKCHAIMQVRLVNTTDADIVLFSPEGVISDAFGGAPLRRFPVTVLYHDIEIKEVRLPPATQIELTFRTPMGIAPIDPSIYRALLFSVVFETSLERLFILNSPATELFTTQ